MNWRLLIELFFAAVALAVLLGVSFLLWRVKGVFSWKRSLKEELKELKASSEASTSVRKAAVGIIEGRCLEVSRSFSPEIGDMESFLQYVRSIAACFYPDSERPELHISIGRVLKSLDTSLGRFDQIFQRPGFNRLQGVSIRNVQDARNWYLRITGSRVFRWYFRHQKKIKRVSQFRLLVFPDPYAWVIYLSRRLSLLLLTKYLLLDLYLFLGKLSLDAYSREEPSNPIDEVEELEEALEEFEELEEKEEWPDDPEVRLIRKRLFGVTSAMTSSLTFDDWKKGVKDAAHVISKKYFPDSEAPEEEAALGPLLERARNWVGNFTKGEQILPVRQLYRVRLDTLYRAKNLSETVLPKPIRRLIENSHKTYGWLKWPLKTYRWSKKSSLWRAGFELGLAVAKRAALIYLYKKAFDRSCKELENVYRQSRDLGRARKDGRDGSERRSDNP